MGALSEAIGFLVKGGYVMIPLMLCSVLAVAVMLERFVVFRRVAHASDGLMEQLRERLMDGRVEEALRMCDLSDGPVARVLANGLRMFLQNRHRDDLSMHIERAMEERAILETVRLQKRLGILDTVITVAPLLGLLGTVTGMMGSFQVLSSQRGLSQPNAITGGVAEALIATATGLAIAIVTLVGYNALTEKVKHLTSEIEVRATQLVNFLVKLQPVKERLP